MALGMIIPCFLGERAAGGRGFVFLVYTYYLAPVAGLVSYGLFLLGSRKWMRENKYNKYWAVLFFLGLVGWILSIILATPASGFFR